MIYNAPVVAVVGTDVSVLTVLAIRVVNSVDVSLVAVETSGVVPVVVAAVLTVDSGAVVNVAVAVVLSTKHANELLQYTSLYALELNFVCILVL